jgi:hypothetical protein
MGARRCGICEAWLAISIQVEISFCLDRGPDGAALLTERLGIFGT